MKIINTNVVFFIANFTSDFQKTKKRHDNFLKNSLLILT